MQGKRTAELNRLRKEINVLKAVLRNLQKSIINEEDGEEILYIDKTTKIITARLREISAELNKFKPLHG